MFSDNIVNKDGWQPNTIALSHVHTYHAWCLPLYGRNWTDALWIAAAVEDISCNFCVCIERLLDPMLSVTSCKALVYLERGGDSPHGVIDKVAVFQFSSLVIKVFVSHLIFMLSNDQLSLLATIPLFILYSYKYCCQYPKCK